MSLFSKSEIEDAARLIYQYMPATPQYDWPLLSQRVGAKVWVKHENHTPTGAFKIRGGITLIDWLKRTRPDVVGVITATRGNHGQSQALAARWAGLKARIIVPCNNSPEKNLAMQAFGAEVIEFGRDFDEARIEAGRQAEKEGLFLVPPYHPEIVRGVATYGLELLTAAPDLDTVYVPIGCGSGICSVITARDALGLATRIVGVVSSEAPAAKLSFEEGRLIQTESANTFADGLAVRIPVPQAFEVYAQGADRIVSVTDAEIARAIRIYYRDTHNLAEGAGAAALAALLQDQPNIQGKQVGVILSGANIDLPVYSGILKDDSQD